MDHAELCTKIWLESKGFTDIQYIHKTHEQPPDFLVENRIAVEVRRLNWMTDDNQGLESIEKPLSRTILEGLQNAQRPPARCKVYVSCDLFSTVLPPKEMVLYEIKQAANQYVATIKNALQGRSRIPHEHQELNCGMSAHFITTQKTITGCFELMDVQAGIAESGLVVRDSIDNINRCIVEKTDKIQNKHHLYEKWWLVLVEHNVYTTALQEPEELQEVKNELVDTTPWSRITILSCLEGMPNIDLI